MISSSSEWVLHSFKQWRLIMLYGACLSMPYVSCIDNFSSKCVYDALMTKTDSKNWFCWTYLRDRKSTRLNSSHDQISYAVFCLKKNRSRCPGHLDLFGRFAAGHSFSAGHHSC